MTAGPYIKHDFSNASSYQFLQSQQRNCFVLELYGDFGIRGTQGLGYFIYLQIRDRRS